MLRRPAASRPAVARPPASSLQDAARILGVGAWDIVKLPLIRRRVGSVFLTLIPGDRQASWPKLRALS